LKVADIAGNDTEAEFESSGRDQQILERDTHFLLGPPAFDAAREPGRLDGTSPISLSTKA
jgi:hypothetical protein